MSGNDQVANVDVFLLLRDPAGRLLLGLRAAHVYSGGRWNLVSGKADAGEDAITAVIREAHEEAGVVLTESDVTPAAVVHYFNSGAQPRVGFGFHVLHDPGRHGLVRNAEPHKCDALGWYAPDVLPQPLEPYTAAVLEASAAPVPIAVAGWPRQGPAPGVHLP